MCWNTNTTRRLLLWYFQPEGKPKTLEIPWECLFPAYFCRQICLSFMYFMTVTQDGQEIAEFKHTLTVIESHSYKVLNTTAWRKFGCSLIFLWKKMIPTLSEKGRLLALCCGSAWCTLEVEPAGRKLRGILSEFDLIPVRILLKSNKLCESLCPEWTCKFCRKHIILEFLSSFWGSETSKI